ncbi:uncharacterized protein LOC125047588 [Penaeus chinensis]|uniref:uncharacterized protein LOC125047588 n=1 Tax=Penaeus chinensis TaxID=139456 RepID=UPI001FB5D5E0|nr:uncharacterized protein LOC125047588 [Penaeus chinensis]
MGKCSWTGFVRTVKQVITFIFSHVGLCAFVAGYSVAGAFLFRQLEQDKVEEYYDSMVNRNECFSKLYNITEEVGFQLNGSHWRDLLTSAAWQERVLQQLEAFEEDLVESVRNQTYDQGPEEQRKRWSVIGSLFYCVTVITTIGVFFCWPVPPRQAFSAGIPKGCWHRGQARAVPQNMQRAQGSEMLLRSPGFSGFMRLTGTAWGTMQHLCYGHVSPRTNTGKMVTIVYALFGIPLMLLCLTNIGNSMATSFSWQLPR